MGRFGAELSYRFRTVRIMQNTTSEPTALEIFFLEAGLPAAEVEACPAPDCSLCRESLARAA